MNMQPTTQEKSSYIFNVEVLVEDAHHAAALEKLIHGMNQGKFLDYRILSGVQLGKLIDQKKSVPSTIYSVPLDSVAANEDSAESQDINKSKASSKKANAATNKNANASAAATPSATANASSYAAPASSGPTDTSLQNDVLQKVELFMSNNTLVRLFINKGLGIKKSIPCRIIRMDQEQQLITVYHVDEKQVYTFHHYEIEDIV